VVFVQHFLTAPLHDWLMLNIAMKCLIVLLVYLVLILAALLFVPSFGRIARDFLRAVWRVSIDPLNG